MPELVESAENVIQGAKEAVLPHFTFLKEVMETGPKLMVRGKGVRLWDIHGKEYIDGMSILWVVNAGHGREEIKEAVTAQMDKISYATLFGGYFNEPAVRLAQKLALITPGDLTHTFFVSGGSEAIETSVKIARQYHQLNGHPNRYKVIGRREAYHGTTYGALSLSGIKANRTPFEPLLPGFRHISPPYCYRCDFGKAYPECDLDCVRTLQQLIEFEGPKTIACVVMEPVMSALGSVAPPQEYYRKIREICDQYGILLVLDEVNNGFGRIGRMFASEHYGITPDMMTFAKGLSSGYMPIGATIVRRGIAEKFVDWMLVHGLTFGGHPLACAAALKNIEIIEKENLPARSAEMGAYLLEKLKTLEEHSIVGDVRGLGLHTSVEYVKDKKTKERLSGRVRIASKVEERMYRRGIYLCRASVDKTYIAPPLIVRKEEIDRIVNALDESIGEVEKEIA
ncbi:MAG: aspartate aminotransferase family protein [Armatimonadetes bacterium]|nr:aspartate aminotransferase family protein [Armatimonadota bacterium]